MNTSNDFHLVLGETHDQSSLIDDGGFSDRASNMARFDDGVKLIDFVLPYMVDKDDEEYRKKAEIRTQFLETLQRVYRLEIEVSVQGETSSNYGSIRKESDQNEKIHYVKLHAPIEALYHAAEDSKMKVPTRVNDIEIKSWYEEGNAMKILNAVDCFVLRHPHVTEPTEYFVQTFTRDRLPEFINHDKPELFFTPAERSRLMFSILQEAPYGNKEEEIGIENLVFEEIFLDAYPLHEGMVLDSIKDPPRNLRQRLQKDWASWGNLFKYQPIEGIREYFGEKIALYFSWLGFYTAMLIPASIVGILCFIYGLVSAMNSSIVADTCSDPVVNGSHTLLMCPGCDRYCSYYLLKTTCMYAKASQVFDNDLTVFFAVFMSVWSALFLEFWKRQECTLAQKWHSMGFEEGEERVRPEYVVGNKTLKMNPVTLKYEPYMPTGAKCKRITGAVSVVGCFVVLILICVVSVIVFRAAVAAATLGSSNKLVREYSSIVVSISAALLNLVAINVLKFLYNKIAVKLTDWENPRTSTDYEDSFTIKMFLFQFANTYASIFYLAFFRGSLITGSPGNYHRIGNSGIRLGGCGARGCFLGLTIQLIIIMVGQQIFSNVTEVLVPTLKKWWNDRKNKKMAALSESMEKQWEDDYEGRAQTKFSLFWEYLEIVLQYGFVTMFVAAFPLAPFFALLNNVLEIRVDAVNYICNNRRPVARRAEDIGAWGGIMSSITIVAILINAFVIAFSSNCIERAVFHYREGHGSYKGFVEWSLSKFNVSSFSDTERPLNAMVNVNFTQSYCRYPGFRKPVPPYDHSTEYWIILAARLGFVLCFVMFVLFVVWLVMALVPDVPEDVALRQKREKYLHDKADRELKEKSGIQKPIALPDKNDTGPL